MILLCLSNYMKKLSRILLILALVNVVLSQRAYQGRSTKTNTSGLSISGTNCIFYYSNINRNFTFFSCVKDNSLEHR